MESVSCLGDFPKVPINANTTYVKYSGIRTMYKILESDSLYMFCSELSNDKKENQFIHRDYPQEAYISCFFNSNCQIAVLKKIAAMFTVSGWDIVMTAV